MKWGTYTGMIKSTNATHDNVKKSDVELQWFELDFIKVLFTWKVTILRVRGKHVSCIAVNDFKEYIYMYK